MPRPAANPNPPPSKPKPTADPNPLQTKTHHHLSRNPPQTQTAHHQSRNPPQPTAFKTQIQIHRVLLSWLCPGVADRAPMPTCFGHRCPTPYSKSSISARRSRSGTHPHRIINLSNVADFGKVILIRGERESLE